MLDVPVNGLDTILASVGKDLFNFVGATDLSDFTNFRNQNEIVATNAVGERLNDFFCQSFHSPIFCLPSEDCEVTQPTFSYQANVVFVQNGFACPGQVW